MKNYGIERVPMNLGGIHRFSVAYHFISKRIWLKQAGLRKDGLQAAKV